MQDAGGDKHFTCLPSKWIDKTPVVFRQISLRAFRDATHRQHHRGGTSSVLCPPPVVGESARLE